MVRTARLFLSIAVVGIFAHPAVAQRSQAEISANGTTISEPGVYQLAELFKHSDIVASVKIVSGDTEHYDGAVYKAQVVRSFKGSSVGETIYFGRYVGERLGWEYFVFLQNADAVVPKSGSLTSYGKVRYSRVFNEGYSSMETAYKCIFDGHDVSEKCDHGVRVCTDYIKLPANTPIFPPTDEDTPFGCRWVRKTLFITLLESIQKAK
jgi:hypothetical protein